MNQDHHPRPEFVSQLEWQLRTSLKREDRFSRPVKPAFGGKMKLAMLVSVSALLGAGGVVVTEEVQEARAQEVLLAKVEGNLRLAELELEMVRVQLEEVKRLYDLGSVDEEAFLSAQAQLRQAELEFVKLTLDQEEIRISGVEPRNQLSAPLVDGRDFVMERLALDESMAAERLSLAERQLARYQQLQEAGIIGSEDLADAVLSFSEAENQSMAIHARMGLRTRFLDGEVSSSEAEREVLLTEARNEVEFRTMAFERAFRQLQAVEERAEAGLLHEAKVRAARLEVVRTELELELARLRLDQLMLASPASISPTSG